MTSADDVSDSCAPVLQAVDRPAIPTGSGDGGGEGAERLDGAILSGESTGRRGDDVLDIRPVADPAKPGRAPQEIKDDARDRGPTSRAPGKREMPWRFPRAVATIFVGL